MPRTKKERTAVQPPLVAVKDLVVLIDDRLVLDHITFDIQRHDIVLIIGPNGAGKTMLLRTMLGLVPITDGSIEVNGSFVPDLAHSSLRIGYVPQRLPFDRDFPLTVRELLAHTISVSKTSHTVEESLAAVGVQAAIDKPIGALSGGQWQRVLLARALVNDPDLLVLDEPTSGVDAAGEASMFDLVHELNHTRHMAVFMVSHDLALAARIASHVLCINQRLVCSAPPRLALSDENFKALYGMNLPFTHEEHVRHA